MDDKIKILLEKLGVVEDHYNYFLDSKLTKIKVNTRENRWTIFISKESMLDIEIIKELEEKKFLIAPALNEVRIVYSFKNINYQTYLSYYPY